ncbi:MAG: bifunctional UDP-N-acetylglucosamine diphosphorylase/glucosamine-1-phosphate N-acetyltransferase GlmU, partial [Pseudomonadota bacterium]
MSNPLHVVVLAAGEGQRMRSARAKVLQPVGGVSMLQRVLLASAALEPAVVHVVVGFDADRVRAELAHFAQAHESPPFNCVEQRERLGTGHAVQQAIEQIPDQVDVLVLPGDMPLIQPDTLQSLRHAFLTQRAALTLISFKAEDPTGYGRILRDTDGQVRGIREQVDASDAERAIAEVNSGVLMAADQPLRQALARLGTGNEQHEYYLTDCVGLLVADGQTVSAVVCADADETLGANDPLQLATLEACWQQRATRSLLRQGVRMPMPHTVQVRGTVVHGRDVSVDAGVIFEGRVELGDDVHIGTGCVLRDCQLASGTRVEPYCVLEQSTTTGACVIGPYARLRPGTRVAADCKIGNFVEAKNAVFEAGAKASHLSYVGDARVGSAANLGAGTITCNYDGQAKHRTEIGAGAFIGSNAALVAPIRIGDRATIGAGSVITRDAPDDSLTLTRARQRSVS